MIFNKLKNYYKAIEEFRVHVSMLDKKTDFDLLIPDIENAEFELRRIIGDAVYDRAEAEYLANEEETEKSLVKYVQGVIANIAFRDYTVSNDLRHTQTGRKAAVNPANEKQAWEFFVERDNQALNFRIQKALNRLIDYLDKNKVAEWISSHAYRMKHQVLLSDIDLFARYYPIDNSLALFNQLLPIQMEMQRKHIAPLLGKTLLDAMLQMNRFNPFDETSGTGDEFSGSGEIDPDTLTTEQENLLKLIDYAGPALALWTMATGIKRLSVKLLPEGLVQQFKSSVQSRDASFNVNPKEKDLIISALIRDAQEATSMLENQLSIINAATENTTVVVGTPLPERNVSTNKYFSM
jgi:hypothetical protein